jgi:hypothetical protein
MDLQGALRIASRITLEVRTLVKDDSNGADAYILSLDHDRSIGLEFRRRMGCSSDYYTTLVILHGISVMT